MNDDRNIIKANTINYRKGFIEVIKNIHEGCINIETWNIHPDKDIETISLGDGKLSDDDVVGVTEIELSLSEARALISLLEHTLEKNG